LSVPQTHKCFRVVIELPRRFKRRDGFGPAALEEIDPAEEIMGDPEHGVRGDRLFEMIDGVVVLTGKEISVPPYYRTDIGRKRVQVLSSAQRGNGFGMAAHAGQAFAVPLLREGMTWVEFEGSLERPLGPGEVPFIVLEVDCQSGIALSE